MKISTNDILKYALIKCIEKKNTNKLYKSDLDDYIYVLNSLLSKKGVNIVVDSTNKISGLVAKKNDGTSSYYELKEKVDIKALKENLYRKLGYLEIELRDPRALLMIGIKPTQSLKRKFLIKEIPAYLNKSNKGIINESVFNIKTYKLEKRTISIIEIEFSKLEKSRRFKKPNWFLYEVTAMKEFEIDNIYNEENLEKYFVDSFEEIEVTNQNFKKIKKYNSVKKPYNRNQNKKITEQIIRS